MKRFLPVLCILLSACCADFLNTTPKGTYHRGNFDVSSGTEMLIISKLFEGYEQFALQTWPIVAMQCHTTDNSHPGGPAGDGGADFCQFPTMTFTPSNSHFTTYYTTNFNAITKANEALDMIAESALADQPLEEVVRDSLAAEAKFIRAAAYFRLTQAFGAVPYVDRVMGKEEKVPAQLSASEIRSRYSEDLKWAIPRLGTRAQMLSSGNIGRASQNSARAILAKTFMYEKNWSECLTYTGQIIESGDNDLNTPYDEIWLEKNECCSESIWEIYAECKPDLNIRDNHDRQWNMMCGVRGTPNLGWGHNAPSEDLMSDYETGDPRYDATILKNGQTLNGETIKMAQGYGYYNKKAYCPPEERHAYGREDWCFGYWVNFRIIRYADIVLMHAEAACEDGQIDEALDKLEMIRKRARGQNADVLPEIEERDKDKLREIIHHERRIELALEFERYFDLVRWGEAAEKIKGFVVGKHELFPIPQQEIDKADGIITQNANY